MRFAVLLALCGLAIAARQSSSYSSEQHYRAGREYRYRFEGHLSAGLPIPGEENSATRVQSTVRLQPENDNYMRLQLTKTRFATSEENRVMSFEHMNEVALTEKWQKVLALPIRFSYRHGMVGEIEFANDEQPWSANIKRAVVNMLQVNLIKKGTSENDYELEHENDFFVSNERTLEGECEVAYTKVEKSEKEQQWTKSINFEKCSLRPEVVYGRRYAEECKGCHEKDEKMSSSVFFYNITGTPEQWLINSVEVQSKHLFAPVSESKQLIVARIYNKLQLVWTGESESQIETVRSSDKKENLIYNPEHEIAEEKWAQTGDEKYLRRLPNYADQGEVIRQQLNRLSKQIEQGVELETNHVMARLVKTLRLATEDNLSSIRSLVSQKSENFQYLYWDALAIAGTKTTIAHLFEKINNKEISPVKASQLMKILAEVRIPSEEIATEFYRFCESNTVSRSAPLRQSCWLSYGSVLNGVCGQTKNAYGAEWTEAQKPCTRQNKEQYIRQLIEKMNQAEGRYEKVLFVKAIANAGIDTSIVELEKVIRNQEVEKTVRMQAIDALRRLRLSMPKKIQNVLMPVYRNHKETPEVRMTALNMILQTQPHQAVLDMIVRGMEKERCQQVRVYTYSTLKSLAKSENPAEKEFSRRVSQAIASMPLQEQKYLESKHMTFSWYKWQSGATLNWATLFSNDSVLPKEVTASLESVFGGEWNKYLTQFGFVQNNLDVVLAKLLQKVEESGIEQLVVRGKRSSSFFRPADMLRSLIESLHITHRQVSSEEPHAMLYLRYKDQDYAFLPIDVDTIPEMLRSIVRDGQLDLSEIEKYLSELTRFTVAGSAFLHETVRKMPTVLGLPLVMTSKMPTVAHINGEVKFDLEPKESERFTGLRLRLKVKPQIASTHVTKLELMTPFGGQGVKLLQGGRIHLPIDAEIEMNWEKKMTIKTTFKTPEQKKRHIAHVMSRPVLFARQWTKDQQRQYAEPREKTIQLREDKFPVHHFEREYFEQTGLKMVVSGSYRRPFTAAWNLGEQVMDVIVEPTVEAPKEVVVYLSLSGFEKTEMEEPRLLSRFYEKESEMFETEYNVDYEQENESERRGQFLKQIREIKSGKAYRHRLHMKIHTVGGAKQQEAECEVRGICDEQMRHCRVNFDLRRSPVEGESRQWELKSTTEWLYPQTPSTLKKMLEQPHREWNCICEAKWGSEQQSEVTIRIQGEQSREQKVWMKRVEREQSPLTQEQKLREAARLNQYKLQATYELHPETRFWMENLYSSFRTYYVWSSEVIPKEHKEGRVQCTLTIEPETRQVYNMTVQTPKEMVRLENQPCPFFVPSVNIARHYGKVESVRHIVKSVSHEIRPECTIKSNEIQTFDEVFYRTPMSPCYSVLAKDCSENPQFAVLMRKIKKGGDEKKLKVISSNDRVITLEKIPEEMSIRVNGKEVSEEDWSNYGISQRGEERFRIELEDVTVEFDGYQTKIKMSALYKNKQCGLCGHYDGEKTNEFRRADNEYTSDLEEFSRSFQHKDEECEVDEQEMSKKRNYKVLREETSSSEESRYESEEQEPIQRNVIVERGSKICFSEEAWPICPSETKNGKSDKKTVQFKCLPSTDSIAQKLKKAARKQVITDMLKEVEDFSSWKKEITIPRTCIAY